VSGAAADGAFNRDAQGRWDQGAAIYDARRMRSRSRWFLALERRMYAALLPSPPAGRRLQVLDAGCGTGELSAWLAGRADVVSVDLSAASLAVARGRPEHLRPVQGDLTRLPIRRASVDAVVSNVVLPHLPDDLVARALRELHGVLRPDGRLIFTVFNWDGLRGFQSFPSARGHFPSGVYYRAYTAPELRTLMAATPFTDVRVRGLGACYALSQPRRGWHGLYHRFGWATLPLEHLVQCRLGLLPRAGAYLVVTARP
jgi:SAM-dependent methyltransferase